MEIEVRSIDVDGARVIERGEHCHVERSCSYRDIECRTGLIIDRAEAAGNIVEAVRDICVKHRARAVVDYRRAVKIELPCGPVNCAVVIPGRAGKRFGSTAQIRYGSSSRAENATGA